MEQFDAVLFDMDGVVIDTHQSVVEFWDAFAAEQGVTLTSDSYERHIYGVPATHTLQALFPHITPDLNQAFTERVTQYELGLQYSEVAGVRSLLRSLKAMGIPTALVTSGMDWKVNEVSRQLDLNGLFDVIVTAADIERGKPDPACYLAAAGRLGITPSGCLVFEDAVSGVRSAIAAGATCVGVQSGRLASLLMAEGARHIIPDFTSTLLEPANRGGRLQLAGGFSITLGNRSRA